MGGHSFAALAAALIVAFAPSQIAAAGAVKDTEGSSESCPAGSGGSCSDSHKARTSCDLSSVLSNPKDFPRQDAHAYFPGMHAICIWRTKSGGAKGYVHFGAVDMTPTKFSLPSKAFSSLTYFRRRLGEELEITKESNDWGYFEMKQEFGLFDLNGNSLTSLEAVLAAPGVMLLEGGQWMWPPVRVGYKRPLEGGLEIETLSLQPLLFSVSGLLYESECRNIVNIASGKMEPAEVYRRKAEDYRTGTVARLESRDYDFIEAIDKRVANLTRIPQDFQEPVQVGRFQSDEYYAYHADAFSPKVHPEWEFIEHGHRNRYVTVLWYLKTVEKGGHTWFPRAEGLGDPEDLKTCTGGILVQPKITKAIMLYNLHANGNFDENAKHAACPPKGTHLKWSGNKWIWNKRTPQRGDQGAGG